MRGKKRAFLIVLDSAGVGAMPDWEEYGDPPGAATIPNVARACGGLSLPNLEALGLGNIAEIEGVRPVSEPAASFGKMAEKAPGKDTTTGHWEMAGVIIEKPLALFPNGFPDEIIRPFVERTGRGVLGNKAASGTEIIAELGPLQQKTGKWIVYTSADSVFQIAAHEEVIPLEELYRACEIAREILNPYNVGRVIARPYVGEPGNYTRTANRRDYALPPPKPTVLEKLQERNIPVIGVGKIANIFDNKGISESYPTKSNAHGMEKTLELASSAEEGLIFVNLVDFDSKFGHRNDPAGYGRALEEFDTYLGQLLPKLREDDLLIITADHGCDPTVPGTDHTREYVPLLVKHPSLSTRELNTRTSFSDIAQSLASYWNLPPLPVGESFL